ncbi:MAG: hypothetical protein JF588_07815 [Caulobacterales bacterium]|nr:hypothetical protein [Caulobacterales bacterium]
MNPALLPAAAAGLSAQLAMVIAGHYLPFVRDNLFAVGGMAISLAAGLWFARTAHAGWPPSLLGGLVAGGACALLGIAVSVALKDTAAQILFVGTLGSAVAGLVGGAVGKLLA